MNLEIIFEVFSMIFCIFYLIVVGISRELIKKEKILLTKLSDEEIEHFSTKKTNTKVFWMVNLGTAILCCIYLLISILNKELLIGVFGETLNKVINSIIIVIIEHLDFTCTSFALIDLSKKEKTYIFFCFIGCKY